MNARTHTEERLVELAGAVADGATPDWTTAEAAADTDEDRAILANLRTIALIARQPSAVGVIHPTIWGSLRILELAGRGRFGDVYRAWDPSLDRQVALKLLRDVSLPKDQDPSDVIVEG